MNLKEILDKHGAWLRCEEEGERANLRGAVLRGANLHGVNLSQAHLTDADLRGANFTDADLTRVSLTDADLTDVILRDGYLRGANLRGANLTGADLTDADLRDADLTRANLTRAILSGADLDLADAYLTRADLTGTMGLNLADIATPAERAERYRLRHPDAPVVPDLDRRILNLIQSGAGTLNMKTWHTCETTHCLAGWAIHLAGEAGAELERKYGPERAGSIIYRASVGRVPDFFGSNEDALEDLRKWAGGAEDPGSAHVHGEP
jgi:hypothetical protein